MILYYAIVVGSFDGGVLRRVGICWRIRLSSSRRTGLVRTLYKIKKVVF